MKACIIQPFYSMDYSLSDELLQWELDALDQCDQSMDLIVLPESADVPAFAKTKADYFASSDKYTDKLLEKCKQTAVRCDAVVFVNASYVTPTGPGTPPMPSTGRARSWITISRSTWCPARSQRPSWITSTPSSTMRPR